VAAATDQHPCCSKRKVGPSIKLQDCSRTLMRAPTQVPDGCLLCREARCCAASSQKATHRIREQPKQCQQKQHLHTVTCCATNPESAAVAAASNVASTGEHHPAAIHSCMADHNQLPPVMPLLAYPSPAPTRQATRQQQSNHHQSYTLLLLNAALSSTTTMDATPEHAWRTLSSWQAAAEGGCN
jgi:hypothetical protein